MVLQGVGLFWAVTHKTAFWLLVYFFSTEQVTRTHNRSYLWPTLWTKVVNIFVKVQFFSPTRHPCHKILAQKKFNLCKYLIISTVFYTPPSTTVYLQIATAKALKSTPYRWDTAARLVLMYSTTRGMIPHTPTSSVADPDPNTDPDLPDPHVFGPPGSGSTSQRYGSGSFYHHVKIVRKTLIPTILWLFFTFYLWKMM